MPYPTWFAPSLLPRSTRRSFCCLVAALASLAALLPAHVTAQPTTGFDRRQQQDQRVASVADRLAIANHGLCGEAPGLQPGFAAHRPGEQGEALLAAGRAPDHRAGVPAAVPSGRGESAGERTVPLDAVSRCALRVEVRVSAEANAWADGRRVLITSAMLDQCRTDDELALVLAHEMAHNILRHRIRLAALGISVTSRDSLSDADLARVREVEHEADRFAAGMVRAAGYDLRQAASFLARLLSANGLGAGAAATHPDATQRLAAWSAGASAGSAAGAGF